MSRGQARWWGQPLAETRAWLEVARLLVDPVLVGYHVPRGDGRPVVLTPGFGAGDSSVAVLAAWLRHIGYRPYTCGFVTNTDCSARALDRVDDVVARLWRRHGRRVAVIGHSRGGHYARAVAARRPERVSHAISMGADLSGLLGASQPILWAVGAARQAARVSGRARSDQCLTMHCGCSFAHDYARPFPTESVRLTSIYSKGDGVVRWETSIVPEAECIEVTGSHVGLIFNRKVYPAIAAALARSELAVVDYS